MKTKPSNIARASYEKNILTLDLPRAVQPMLWRQEIKNISNVTFWLAAEGNSEHTLLMRIGTGADQTIARFADAAVAEESLAAVREIFMKKNLGGGSILAKIGKALLWILLIWILGHLIYMIATGVISGGKDLAQQIAPQTTTEPAVTPAAPPAASPAPATTP